MKVICTMLMLLLFSCSSPSRQDAEGRGKSGFILCPPPERLYEPSADIRFSSRGDTSSLDAKVSERSKRDLIIWSGYSPLGALPTE